LVHGPGTKSQQGGGNIEGAKGIGKRGLCRHDREIKRRDLLTFVLRLERNKTMSKKDPNKGRSTKSREETKHRKRDTTGEIGGGGGHWGQNCGDSVKSWGVGPGKMHGLKT